LQSVDTTFAGKIVEGLLNYAHVLLKKRTSNSGVWLSRLLLCKFLVIAVNKNVFASELLNPPINNKRLIKPLEKRPTRYQS
jgi:hypothetical protein